MRLCVRRAGAALAALALAGCGSDESATKGPVQNSEILEGSASDDMIAYDQLRSEPPVASPAPIDAGTGKPGGPSRASAAATDAPSETPSEGSDNSESAPAEPAE